MKATFALPAAFEVTLRCKHALKPVEGPTPEEEPTMVQDMERMVFYARLLCDGKVTCLESRSFAAVEQEVNEAYWGLRELLTEVITRAVLPNDRCPQFEVVEGVIRHLSYGKLNPDPVPLNTEE